MPGELRPLRKVGENVVVATASSADLSGYQRAVHISRERLRDWNPVNPHDLAHHLRNQSGAHRTFIVHARHREGEHDIVGRVNVANIVRGRSQSAALGYDAYDPYVGRGLFAEGLRLLVDLAFTPEPDGLGLHRLEAHVQPGNVRSAGMLRSIGFRPRGAWPSFMWLPDASGVEDWRDHVSYGITAPEWPAASYQKPPAVRPVVIVTAPDETCSPDPARSDPHSLARLLAQELAVPLLVMDRQPVTTSPAATQPGLLAEILREAYGGAVVLGTTSQAARQLLDTAGIDPDWVVWFDVAQLDGPPQIVRAALQARAQAWSAG